MTSKPSKAEQILIELGKDLGIEPTAPGQDQDMTLSLEFDNALNVFLAAEDEDVVICGHLGELPENAVDLMETLLAANLYWRDTNGATISLDPDTRAILMAQRLPQRDWTDVEALRQTLSTFTEVQEAWTLEIQEATAERSHERNIIPHDLV